MDFKKKSNIDRARVWHLEKKNQLYIFGSARHVHRITSPVYVEYSREVKRKTL